MGIFDGAKMEDIQIVRPGTEPVAEQQANPQGSPAPTEQPAAPPAPGTPPPAQPQPEVPPQETPPVQHPQSPPEVPPQTPAAPIAEPPKQEPTVHQPFLKTEQPKPWDEVLKENGFDDFDIGLLKYRKETGDVTPYLEVKSVNYKDMPAEELMRRELREQYPSLSREGMDRLYRKQVIDKYTLDPDQYDPEDVALGKEMLEHDAGIIRNRKIENQAKFAAPERKPDDTLQKQQEAMQQQAEAFRQSVTSNPATQQLLKDKRLALDAGEGKFNFEVTNPQDAIDVLFDADKYQKFINRPDGTPDIEAMLELAAFVTNRKLFKQSLINHGKTLGTKQLVTTELENSSKETNGQQPAGQEESLFDAFRNRGIQSWQRH